MSDATNPTSMKAAIFHQKGDPTTARVISVEGRVPIPEPTKGQILVKVAAASINPVDWKMMDGSVPMKQGPAVGSDVSGTIHKIGPNTSTTTTTLKVGDEVYGDGISTKGSFAEYMICEAKVLSPKPSSISHDEAAALPLAGLTALQGLRLHGQLEKGQKVLVFGGSGGVGSLAIQIAKALGAAEVTSTCGTSNVKLIQSLGADVVVDYKTESLMETLQGKDFDLVLDTIGGYEHWEIAQASLKKGGRFLTIVGDGGNMLTGLMKMVFRQVQTKFLPSILGGGNALYSFYLTNTSYDALGDDMAKLTELVDSGKLKSVLDERRFALTTQGIHDMIQASKSHRAKGKLILQVSK